jgi:hypothetical protein
MKSTPDPFVVTNEPAIVSSCVPMKVKSQPESIIPLDRLKIWPLTIYAFARVISAMSSLLRCSLLLQVGEVMVHAPSPSSGDHSSFGSASVSDMGSKFGVHTYSDQMQLTSQRTPSRLAYEKLHHSRLWPARQ